MDESERQQLAQRLSAVSMKDARKEILRLDSKATVEYWRNSYWDEYHTLYLLPNAGLSIALVEKSNLKDTNRTTASSRGDQKVQKVTFKYIEARVNPLNRPVKNVTGVP